MIISVISIILYRPRLSLNSISGYVVVPSSFIETPVDQIVLEGSSVTFRCLATGNPTPAVQWFKDGKLIGSEETLTFKANRDHDGKYWCSVSNGISEAINTSAILDVHCKYP